jgi:hypothetical protein
MSVPHDQLAGVLGLSWRPANSRRLAFGLAAGLTIGIARRMWAGGSRHLTAGDCGPGQGLGAGLGHYRGRGDTLANFRRGILTPTPRS